MQIARDPAGTADEYLAMLERVDGGYEHLPARNLARTYPGMAALRESVVGELVHLGALRDQVGEAAAPDRRRARRRRDDGAAAHPRRRQPP